VVLSQATAQGQCRFARPNSLKKPEVINGEDVCSLTPMVVYWKADNIHEEYSDTRTTIPCVHLFETNLDYKSQVIGYVPDEHCPDPPHCVAGLCQV
jgi:hypothetical protein